MREIIFRGKQINTGKWTQGYPFCICGRAYILWGTCNDIPCRIEVDPETVCQCTGITDSNGRLIFEKDIVSYPDCEISSEDGSGDCFENIGVVEWDSESMGFYFTDRVTADMNDIDIKAEVDVIGNVFDNRNLVDD